MTLYSQSLLNIKTYKMLLWVYSHLSPSNIGIRLKTMQSISEWVRGSILPSISLVRHHKYRKYPPNYLVRKFGRATTDIGTKNKFLKIVGEIIIHNLCFCIILERNTAWSV